MLDLFSIFSKGGIVLWCFQSTSEIFTPSVNALIRGVILQERSGNNTHNHNTLTLQYKLDNEFELVFVVAYQRILQLSYIDKFLNDIHLEFRDKYKNELQGNSYIMDYNFMANFERVLKECEQWAKTQAKIPKQMRTFEDSQKSKKTVASMIERKGDDKNKKSVKIVENKNLTNGKTEIETPEVEDDVIVASRARLAQKMASKKKEPKKSPKSPKIMDRVKKPRVWELSGDSRDVASLEFTTDKPDADNDTFVPDTELIGQMQGKIRDLEVESEEESSSEEEQNETRAAPAKKTGGMFSLFKGLVGSKALSEETMRPVLDKLRDHLIMKNVAADIANKLCDSVATRLQGRVLGTFDSVAKTIKSTLTESLVQILSPKRRVDILRDCLQAKQEGRPYVMAFCGVNGVGKSTNLAKICFWLIENNLSVLIAACDTFRAGAVEQLRTHTRHLNALHPPEKHGRTMVQLYEKGYGKDAAGIAMEAIRYAVDTKVDVVLIDTAGRMQDNEPLMRALAKLIKVNEPDMVLFVGEALVGNEAVDQLVKFNQALADHSSTTNPHTIDGIVLTKFDTIDDKVVCLVSTAHDSFSPTLKKLQEMILDLDSNHKTACTLAYTAEEAINVILLLGLHRRDLVLLGVYMFLGASTTALTFFIYTIVFLSIDLVTSTLILMEIVYQCYFLLLVRSEIVNIKEQRNELESQKEKQAKGDTDSTDETIMEKGVEASLESVVLEKRKLDTVIESSDEDSSEDD